MPFNTSIGLRVTRVHADGITVECPLREDLMNGFDVLHSGVTATVADAAVGIALWRHNGGRRPATTVEMKVNFMRAVARGKIVARARLLRVGSTLCIGQVDMFDAQRNRVAAALVTYMMLDAPR